ncbi:MAG: 2,4-dihydroxyhept-2-ene-1,7-dioic acid aldolase [Clostridia bacterium]|nr:2,4-dihydroxyhept-2-ene-1,7-dioic acid aldolase [Erysipelotrichia bacterium]NCC88067.1 2,4-dihydroxyhept-2-ene-1,7-dioic acid aldolase [Clostridia bacterium]
MDLKALVKKRKIKGLLVKIVDNPAIVIMAQNNGMDFIFYDCEHGVLANEKLHDLMVFANAINYASIVRVPQLARADVSKMLDYGATGIMVPMVESKEQAQQLVMWSKYSPIGKRSYSGGANTHYGESGNHALNMRKQNERTLSIVQIETLKGVVNIDEILSVDGIDAAIVGPCDLAISMDNPDHVMAEQELAMIKKVAKACKEHEKAFGMIGNMRLLKYFKEDIDILVSAIDTNIIREGIKLANKQYEQIED